VVAALGGAADVVAADAVGRVPVADAALPVGADRVAREAMVGDAAVRAAVDAVKAKAVTAMADAEMVEANWSRT
jgi:hypothetical protein